MWDLIVSIPDHCLSFYFILRSGCLNSQRIAKLTSGLLLK